MRLPRLALTTMILCHAVPVAAEDSVRGTLGVVRDTSHQVHVVIDRGHARLTSLRTVVTTAEHPDRAEVDIALPAGGVGVGLRLFGSRGHWLDGAMLTSAVAREQFEAGASVGDAPIARDMALLSFPGITGSLGLGVFPVRPGVARTVEIVSLAPTEHREGLERLTIPAMGTAKHPAELIIEGAHPGDEVTIDGAVVGTIARRRASTTIEVAVSFASARVLEGRLASVPLTGGTGLVRMRAEVAPRLGVVPEGASVVVVMDASRSVTEDEAAAMRAAAGAFLSQFPGAKADLVAYDRRAAASFGKLVPVREAIRAVEGVALGKRNGSNLDAALVRAAELLSTAPPGSSKRILVLTDTRTRSSLSAGVAAALVERTGAVLHVAVPELGAPFLSRDDEHAWAPLARATGGVLWRATAGQGEHRGVYEELARPLRLDRVRVTLDGIGRVPVQTSLAEGESVEDLRIAARPAAWFGIEGEVWSRPSGRVIVADATEGDRWAALAIGKDLELAPEDVMRLARRGHAVTAETSLLASDDAPTASKEGLSEAFGAAGLGLSGSGTSGVGGIGRVRIAPTPHNDGVSALRERLLPVWRACGGTTPVTVVVETTLAEIVDVSVPPGGECLAEAAWNLELPDAFRAPFARWVVLVEP